MPTSDEPRFPFGTPLRRTPAARPPRGAAAFVLGVHSGAVHARWLGPDGRERCRSLPVAAEPVSFWRGEGAAEAIAAIGASVPASMGRLEPADAPHNGAMGRALDDYVLGPLGLAREDCFITDLHDEYLLAPSNRRALARYERDRAEEPSVPSVGLPARPRVVRVGAGALERIRRELEASRATLVVTLGNEPAEALLGKRAGRLEQSGYGHVEIAEVFGRRLSVLRLCHPRHPARLGSLSPSWELTHGRWVREVEKRGGLEGIRPGAEVRSPPLGAMALRAT